MRLPIYIDIDGTLTSTGTANGPPILSRIGKVKFLIAGEVPVVIWSASGTEYAQAFCKRHGIEPLAALGKPDHCIDDNPTVRPNWSVADPKTLD